MQIKLHKIYLSHLNSQVSNYSGKEHQSHASGWQYTLAIHHQAHSHSQYEVSLSLKAELKREETVLAVLDIKQSGLFAIPAANQEELAYALAVLCPQTLLPHLQRQAFTISSHIGLVSLVLPQADFNQAYTQQLESLQEREPSKLKSVQEINKNEDKEAERESVKNRKGNIKESTIQRAPIVIPEQALAMVFIKLFENTLAAIKCWWNKSTFKAEGEEVSIEELIQSHAVIQKLNIKINKLLQQEAVDRWYRYHLEDLAEDIQTADRSSITRKKAKGWERDLQVLREDFEPETEHVSPIKKYRQPSINMTRS
jgi:preprotein translocase subunit SecB